MLIGLVLLLGLATVPLARGRLGAVADVRFRAVWLAARTQADCSDAPAHGEASPG
jgi:hypothetical protein